MLQLIKIYFLTSEFSKKNSNKTVFLMKNVYKKMIILVLNVYY